MFIADDVTDIGSKATWCASLNGALIVMPRSILDKMGPVLKYFPAKHPHRTAFFSNGFRVKHGRIVDLLEKSNAVEALRHLGGPPRVRGRRLPACLQFYHVADLSLSNFMCFLDMSESNGKQERQIVLF